jgi:hypothetical protein
MKRHTVLLTASVLILTIILLPASTFGLGTPGVTGAGEAAFPAGTLFAAVPVSGLTFGMGVLIYTDGSAVGDFQATLAGLSVLGQSQSIEVEGTASAGVLNADGSRTFSGSASVDMGDGSVPLTSVPVTLTATTTGLLLSLGTTNLPSAALTDGGITLQ